MKNKRGVLKVLLITAVTAVLVIGGLAFTYRSRAGSRALPVDVYTVARTALEETVTGTGSFVPEFSSVVHARVSGVAERVHVEAGDTVSQGDVLLELDQSDFQRALRQAESVLSSSRRMIRQNLTTLRAAYRNALTARDQARRNYEQNLELLRVQAITQDVVERSKDALDSASVNLRSAREQLNLVLGLRPDADPSASGLSDEDVVTRSPDVAQAQVALETARVNLDRTIIRAPQEGTVTQIVPSAGDLVVPNTPVARVESLDRMLAEIQVDEVDIGKISRGISAELTSDSLLGETLRGTVVNIAPVISQVGNTRVTRVRIDIEEEGRTLKAGASTTARISTLTRENVLTIPLTAFITRGNLSYAYVLVPPDGRPVDEGQLGVENPSEAAGNGSGSSTGNGVLIYRLEERRIETGLSTIDRIEVLSGLSSGDLVANGSLDVLRHGMNVIPRDELLEGSR